MRALVAAVAILLVGVVFAPQAWADISSLGVVGPTSATGGANIGAVTRSIPATTLERADVAIVLKPGENGDLVADYSATFELETSAAAGPAVGLVAFPVTGLMGKAVQSTTFAVAVDGVAPPTVMRKYVRWPGGMVDEPVQGVLDPAFSPKRIHGIVLANDDAFSRSYLWTQTFTPGKRTHVSVKYQLQLRPQSIGYVKRYLHDRDPDTVPFDLMMVAGDATEQAFFLDYILRSGATWTGPIGHETVTLTADPALGLEFRDYDIVFVGRNVAAYGRDDTRVGASYYSAGVDPTGLKRPGIGYGGDPPFSENKVYWRIDHEKPTQDILVEIPLEALHCSPHFSP